MLRLRTTKTGALIVSEALAGFLLLSLCVVGAQYRSQLDTNVIPRIAVLFCFFWLWRMHLTRNGFPWHWAMTPVLIAAWETSTRIGEIGSLVRVSGCLFAYLTVWMFTAYRRQPGLQPVATMALVICAAALANPTVGIGCAALALASFALNPHQAVGGRFGFALLLFTPATLCVLATVALGFLGMGTLMAYPLAEQQIAFRAAPSRLDAAILARQFAVPIAILSLRVAARRAGASDLALLLMMFAALGATQLLPAYCDLSGVWLMSLGGAAFLLTNAFDWQDSANAPV